MKVFGGSLGVYRLSGNKLPVAIGLLRLALIKVLLGGLALLCDGLSLLAQVLLTIYALVNNGPVAQLGLFNLVAKIQRLLGWALGDLLLYPLAKALVEVRQQFPQAFLGGLFYFL